MSSLRERFNEAYLSIVEPKPEILEPGKDNLMIVVNMGEFAQSIQNPSTQVLEMSLNSTGTSFRSLEKPQNTQVNACVAELEHKMRRMQRKGAHLRGVTIVAENGTDVNEVVGVVTKIDVKGVWSGNGLKVAYYNSAKRFVSGYTLTKKDGKTQVWTLRSEDVGVITSKK